MANTDYKLEYINFNCLPPEIEEVYSDISYKIRPGIKYCQIHKVFSNFNYLQGKNKLYENIGIDNERHFVILSNKRHNEFVKEYHKGLIEGYNKVISFNTDFENLNSEQSILKLFNIVKNQLDTFGLFFAEIEYDSYLQLRTPRTIKLYLCIELHFFEHGFEFGKYLKIWNTIIDYYSNPFKEVTEPSLNVLQNTKDINPNILFNISQTELIELIKALIENGNIKGKQKDIINSFSSYFNIEINNPDKLITDIKKRNTGSETLFIDKLKSSLYNYITKENKR